MTSERVRDALLALGPFGVRELALAFIGRGLLLEKEDYRQIVHPAIVWAFERTFGGPFVGSSKIRRVLEDAAHRARVAAHEVIKEEFVAYLNGVDLERKENWYLQATRELIETLLANQSCTAGSAVLAGALKKVNAIQRARPRTVLRAAYAE